MIVLSICLLSVWTHGAMAMALAMAMPDMDFELQSTSLPRVGGIGHKAIKSAGYLR